MKKFITISIIALLLFSAIQAQPKQVAMLEPLGTASSMQKAIIRASLAEAITNSGGYEALSRTDIDQIMNEFNFQMSGMVSDDQLKELGRMSGAELLCITRLTSDGSDFFVESSLIEIQSGRIVKTANELMAGTPNAKIKEGCVQLAAKLVGQSCKSTTTSTLQNSNMETKSKFTEGKEITFACEPYPKTGVIAASSHKVELFLDGELIGTGKGLRDGFVFKIKDPTPGSHTLKIDVFQLNKKGKDIKIDAGGGSFLVDTSKKDYFEFTVKNGLGKLKMNF